MTTMITSSGFWMVDYMETTHSLRGALLSEDVDNARDPI